jgi:peptide/nickel transport system permease protein
VLTIRRREFIEAAQTLGATDLRIVLRHVRPNTVAPVLVIGSSQFATDPAGVRPELPRDGNPGPAALVGAMLSEGRDYLSNAWWLVTAPGVMKLRGGASPHRFEGMFTPTT